MLPRHVTFLAAMFVCHVLLSCAHDSPNEALLKILSAKHAAESALPPSSSSSSSSSPYLTDYRPRPFPSSYLSLNDVTNDLWLQPSSSAGTGTNPLLMRAGSSLTSSSAGTSPVSEEETEMIRNGFTMAKRPRFHPQAFFGSRGKRLRFHRGFVASRGKRFFHQGFVGSRGKRLLVSSGLLGGERMMRGEQEEDQAERGGKREDDGREREDEEEEEEEEGRMMHKRFNTSPALFSGSRDKRYLPGLEALLLSQMYRKLDAEKLKRQSLLGFHAARG